IRLKEDYALWALMVCAGAATGNVADTLVHAMAGPELHLRRGGWRYAWAEVALQRHLVATGVKGWAEAVLHGTSRVLVFLISSGVRAWIYARFLRSPAAATSA